MQQYNLMNVQNNIKMEEKSDGTLASLREEARKLKSHPNQYTEEIKLIKAYKANNKETVLVVFWVKLLKAGYIRIRYIWFTNKHSTYSSSEFAKKVVRYFPFKIKCIQTDNGMEFTNRLNW